MHNPCSNRHLTIRSVPVRGIWITLTLENLGRDGCSPNLIAADEKIRPKMVVRRFRFTAAAFQRTFYGKLGRGVEGRKKGGRDMGERGVNRSLQSGTKLV